MIRSVFATCCLLALVAAPLWAQVVEVGDVVVLDGNDRFVGPIVNHEYRDPSGQGDDVYFALFVDDIPYLLRLASPADVVPAGPANVLFEEADCSGTPYIPAPPAGVLNPQLFLPSAPVYDQVEGELILYIALVPGDISPQTGLNLDYRLVTGGCVPAFPPATAGVEAIAVNTGFTGSFHLGRVPQQAPLGAPVPAVQPVGLALFIAALLCAGFVVLNRAWRCAV